MIRNTLYTQLQWNIKMKSVIITLLLLSTEVAKAGRWVEIDFTADFVFGFNHGLTPFGKNSIRGEAKACSDVELYLTEDGDLSNYAMWQIFYYSYYTALMDNGASYKTYDFRNDLACDTWKKFWFSWENGVFTMGYGLEVGTNQYLSSDFLRDVPVNQIHMRTRSSDFTGTWRWLLDEPPLFSSPNPNGNEILEIAEDTAQYSVIYNPTGTDPDGDTITFSTYGDHKNLFTVYSGSLYTMETLDYETTKSYFLNFEATDGEFTIRNSLYIQITNVIDVTPVVTVYTVSIPEELPVGTDIGKVVSIVDDEEDDSWTIYHGGTNYEYLNLDTTTHIFTVKERMDLDAGEIPFSGVYVVCLDSAYNYDYKYLALTVYDINDNFPVFSSEYYHATLTEGTTAGAAVKTLAASDGDATNGGFTTSILSENGETSGFSFSLNDFDLTTAATLDYEALESVNFEYVLVLKVVDKPTHGEPHSSTTVVRVTVEPLNDFTPVWETTPTGATLPEDTDMLEVITQLQASDSDLGPDGAITYFILSVDPASGTDLFTVDAYSGEVRVGGQLDFDSATGGISSYTINVRASDNGGSPKYVDGTVTVTITNTNDNAPIFDEIFASVTLSEDRGVDVDLLRIGVDDIDGDTVTLSIETGGDGHFSILNHMMRYVSAVDYETKRRHIMLVKGTDGVHNSYIFVEVIIQNAMDNAPVITMISTSAMAEEQAVGSAIFGGYIVRDDDVGDTLSYAISGADAAYVTIDAGTGALVVAQNVDFDSGKTQLDLTLTVTDSAGLQDTESFSISVKDINDLPPIFNPDVYEAEVTENTHSGVSLLTFTLSDGDSGNNAKYNLAVSSGMGGQSFFKVSSSGTLDLETGTTPTDYESLAYTNFMYTLVVTAVDKPDQGAPKTGSAIVRITVKPENEYAPVWSNSHDGSGNFNGATVSEDDPLGTLVDTFTATDDDLLVDGSVTYSIVSVTAASGASAPNKFSICKSTGKLVIAGELDFDSRTNGENSYTVAIRASDKASSPKTVDGSIVITLTNVNDNPSFFDSDKYEADVKEDLAVGSVVKTLVTDDYDNGDTVTLSIFSGDNDGLFECVGNDVKIKSALDYETKAYHFLVVRANDGVHNTDVALVVNVLDVSDEAPVITVDGNGIMSEEQAIGSGVCGSFAVADPDVDDTLTYSLGGADSGYLSINSATGALSVAKNVNRDGAGGRTVLEFTLTVTDTGGQSTTEAFPLKVRDINDQVPLFDPSEYSAEVTENSAADISLLDLTCTDADEGDNALFDVTVASGDGEAGVFKMDGLQLLTDANPPDYEALGSSGFMYTLIITAVDKPTQGEPNTGTAIVRVTVKPENEFTPVWTAPNSDGSGNFNGATVSEGDLPGTLITTFQASDDDLGDDGRITYTVFSATDNKGGDGINKFSMDASTGDLRVAGKLDVDAGTNGVTSYTVTVRASDNGGTSKKIDGVIVVTLTNVNDNPPFFDQTDYSADVDEDNAVGTVVATLNVNDYDDGDVVTLSVASGSTDLFECEGLDVKIKSGLDYETDTFHVLIIRATDGIYETDVSLQVNVNDVIDEPPIITKVEDTKMSEEQAMDTGLSGGYIVTDPDAGDVLTYTLSGADSGYLTIDASTGELSIAQNVNREGANAKSELSLTLTVEDKAALQATLDFTIAVVDINDLPPVFNPVEYTAEVAENSASDMPLVDLTLSDGDEGNNAVFTLDVTSGDGGSGVFKISGHQLQTTGTVIDYESLESSEFIYTLVIKAVDMPDYGLARTGTAIVKITVTPENDFTPVWTQPDSSGSFTGVTITEDSGQGYLVTTFQATDDDLGDDGVVTYSVFSVTGDSTGNVANSMFVMDDETGELLVAGNLDYDLDSSGEHSYTVVVRASDKGATPNQVDGTIVVTLTGVNDNPPRFDQSEYSADVKENEAVDSVVHTFTVEDYDGDTPTLSVITGRSDLFMFDGLDLKLKDALDYETETTYILYISASDGTFSTIVTLQVNVVDIIDEKPIITVVTTSSSVSEEQTVGTAVYGGFVVTDPDNGDTLAYSLSGSDSDYLTIDTSTGELTVGKNVDREGTTPKTSLSFTLTVTDQAGLQASKDISITVEDINDITPYFTPSVNEIEVTENTPSDTALLDLTCDDDDAGNNAVYTISLEGGDDTTYKFKMVGQQLQTDNPLDYETRKTYLLTIIAVDTPDQGDANTGTAVVKVMVKPENDFSPEWVSPAIDGSGNFDALNIDESTVPGTSILILSSKDQDHGDDGVIEYSIVSVTDASGAAAGDKFSIDPSRGNITVANYLDIDTATNGVDSYTIIVRASDKASSPNAVEGSLVVRLTNINDNPPFYDQTEYKTSVQEDSVVGSVVISFNTQDYDNDAMTLSIEDGATDLFEVDGSNLKVKDALDFETAQFHVLRIRVTDGLFNTNVPVLVNILDVLDETPLITNIVSTSMAEGQPVGTPVYGGYEATDRDVDDVLTYTLGGADSSYFSIDASNGHMTVAQHVDREAGLSSFSLIIIVTDQAGLQETKDFTIAVEDINDQTPLFDQTVYEVTVEENTAPDTSLLDLTCTDDDAGNNAVFTISVGSGDDTTSKFKFSGNQLQTDAAIDFETSETYTLIVTAVDTPDQGEPNTGTTVVKVKVTPVNEHTPVWSMPDSSGAFTASVDETAAAGHVVATFSASDDDKGDDGLVTYSIVTITAASGVSANEKFSIGEKCGTLVVAASLDYDADTSGEASYTIVVRASDSGTTPNTVDGTITVSLNNRNDNPPFFKETKYQVDVSEDEQIGFAIISPETGDFDGDTVKISILKGDSSLFKMDGNEVQLSGLLDYETLTSHVLVIKASDGKYEAEVSLQVDVVDVIDETPVITIITGTPSLSEEQTVGTAVIANYFATDADAQDELTYSLSGADSGLLNIDSSTGHLTVAQNIDREGGKTQLDITLIVSDKAGLKASEDIVIEVRDINDNAPSFSPYMYEIEVSENTASDTSLVDLTCSDDDSGNNAVFSLSVDSGDDADPKFKISGQQLQTDSNAINYDTMVDSCFTYTLIILATDNPDEGSPKTGVAIVKVTVKPENEFTPVWSAPDSSGAFTSTVDEDASVGVVLITVQATDDDKGNDGLVTYSIVSVTGDTTGSSLTNLFSMDASTGQLKVAGELDRDLATGGEASYTIAVKASDNGATPKSVDGTIIISPVNINDNTPSFLESQYEVEVSESTAVGTGIISLNMEDNDNDAMSLTIISGRDDLFEVDGSSIKIKAPLDFETASAHVLLVNVTDGAFTQTVSVQISVTDINDEPPIIIPLTPGSLTEGQIIGTGAFGGFDVSDPDPDDKFTFSLSGDNSPFFNINSSSGEVTVADHVEGDGPSGLSELTDLTLTVTDNSGNQANKAFKLIVADLNDLAPTFNPELYSGEVSENTASGTSVLTLTCDDGDSGNNAVITYSIVSGDDTAKKFTTTTNELFTDVNAIDYEALEASDYLYSLVVHATDSPDQGDARTGTAVINIKVLPVNEFDPVWSAPSADGSASVELNEDSDFGTLLTTFEATDDDHGDDGKVMYSIVSATGGTTGMSAVDLFTIDPLSGRLTTKGRLDRDLSTGGEETYTVIVQASDSGENPKTIDGTVIITPQNINDNAPYFDESHYQVTVDEDSAVGTIVSTLVTKDPDADTVTLSIESGGDGLFEIVDHDVKIKTELDFEAKEHHTLLIKATDGTYDAYVSLEIDVVDKIDETPVITMVTTGAMSEGQIIGTAVKGGYSVTDKDADDVLEYALSGAHSSYLKINSSTGALTVELDVDREGSDPKTELSLTLTVKDSAGNEATKDFTITVEDINDSPPTCDPAVFLTDVVENTAADVILLDLTCSDNDDGDNAKFDVTIGSGDDTDAKFKMSGLQLLTSSTPTDYESLKDADYMYTLVITAVDKPAHGEAKTGTAIVKVTVKPENEYSPEWNDPVPDANGYLNDVTVDEDSPPGTPITTLTSLDADQADDGVVTYEIMSIKLDDGSDAADTFVIGAHTGDLQVKSELDAEGDIEYYDISLRAVDGGNPAKEATAAIKVYVLNVNDMPPKFSENKYLITVSEDTDIGTPVHTMTVNDPDDGDTITLAVDGDGSDIFKFVGLDLELQQKLDFETKRYHSIIVSASDGKHKVFVSMIVIVGNVFDEPPTINIIGDSLVEEQLLDTIIGNIFTVTDLDEGDSFEYSLSGENANLLSINETTGVLSIHDRVDNDLGSHILDKITLTVTDKGKLSTSTPLTFKIQDINDNPPLFAREDYLGQVTESSSASESVLDFTLTDADTGPNAQYKLKVSAGDDIDNPKFSIAGTTLYADSTSIDAESMGENSFYELTVEAVDTPDEGQAMTGVTTVLVMVMSRNEFNPKWESHTLDETDSFPLVNITENTPFGSTIANYTASDDDVGKDGLVEYKVLSANASDGKTAVGLFEMLTEDGHGRLVTSAELDADTSTGGSGQYILVISAVDLGNPARSVTGTVTVEVNDVNDPVPQIPADNTEEKWILRGALIVTSVALAASSIAYGANLIASLKTPSGVNPYPNGMERPQSMDEEFTMRNRDLEPQMTEGPG